MWNGWAKYREHWGVRRLKDVGRLIAGSAFPEALQGIEGEELPFYKVADMNNSDDGRWMSNPNHTISRTTADMLKARVVPAKAVVYAKIGAALLLNRRRLTIGSCCIDNNMSAYVPDNARITTEWALYACCLLDFKRHVNPGAVPSLSEGDQSVLPILVPSVQEQRAIATFLDAGTAKIDTLVAKNRLLLERLAEYRTALITRTVTKGLPPEAAREAGLNPNTPLKPSGVEWLGEVPEHWDARRVSSLARSGKNSFIDGDWVELPYITDSGVRLIQTGNIGIGAYREQGYRYIDESSFDELHCTEVDPGDVLICRLADPVGRACRAPSLGVRMITSVDVCILKPSDEHSAAYLTYLLSSKRYLNYVDSLVRGGTRDRISRSMLGAIRVPTPPYEEQRAIAAFLDGQTGRVDDLRSRVETAIERLQEYRTALITAAVTGKIDVRDHDAVEMGDSGT